VLRIAERAYERLLTDHGLLDFAAMLDKAVALLERQEEFARSRLKLQSRYHHVLVDEFQDTSRRQWRLVELLIDAWGEGAGAADAPTSIFVVGDRKQSIYRFRHAEVTLLDEAARRIGILRGQRPVRQAITTSFRAVPELLAFVNALSSATPGAADLEERFSFEDHDRFPVSGVADGAKRDGEPVVGVVAESSMAACARAVATEIERLVDRTTVRDRATGPRPARPDDIAILFRSRAGHRYYEEALEARGIRTYVYKGLGFFDAPEVQDLQAILRFLARPESDLRAAEFLRSRVVRLSDIGLARLAPSFSAALTEGESTHLDVLDGIDRDLLKRARASVAEWLRHQDLVPPSELVDRVLRDAAYTYEIGGRRLNQARENVKKVRALVRRVESRGYATLERIAAHFDSLRTGEESNAVVDASGAVNLMTIHAAKGLEFPIVFLVNLHVGGRGRSGGVSIIERGVSGSADVVFGSNESTRLEDRRDEEELRRLLYVAVTRARDRVYLAAEVGKNGQVRRPPRSLAALFPDSFLDVMAAAAATSDHAQVRWTTPEGSFDCRVCRAPVDQTPTAVMEARPASREACSLAPLVTTAGRGPTPVVDGEGAGTVSSSASDPGHRLVGTLVHRLLAQNRDISPDDPGAIERVMRLLRGEEAIDVVDRRELAVSAVRQFAALRRRPDLVALLESGACHFELPFSLEMPLDPGGVRVRGSIDCLVLGRDGAATVVEFKTGRPRPAHAEQLEIYRQAACEFLQRTDVQARIFYAE
jgi:ATP-dependent exoDNAse (exonuclease V) beta subunit